MIATDALGEVERDQDTHTHTHTSPVHYAYIYSYSYHLVYQHSGYRRPSEPEKYTVYVPTLPSDFTRRYFTSIHQTNKERKKERKKENNSSSKSLHLCNSPSSPAGEKRPSLPTIVCWCEGNQCYTTCMYFCENQKSQQYLTYLLPLPLSLSALGPSNTYSSNLRAFQSSPVQ